jgi:hypothetical protein
MNKILKKENKKKIIAIGYSSFLVIIDREKKF